MKRILTLFSLSLSLIMISCRKPSVKKESDMSFQAYLDQLPQIELPYHFACDTPFVWPDVDYESALVKKYNQTYARILGKVFQSDLASCILYTYAADVSLPVIHIYDTQGDMINTVELYELGDCWYEDGCGRFIRGVITKDLFVKSYLSKIDCDSYKLITRMSLVKKIETSGDVSTISKDSVESMVSFEDFYSIETYQTNKELINPIVIDKDCAVLIYPSDKQIEYSKREYGEDFATIADDGSWYQYQSNHLLDSMKVKVVLTNGDYLKLIGNCQTWSLDIKRNDLPMWNLIFFKKDKEPKIVSMPGLTTEEITNFFK